MDVEEYLRLVREEEASLPDVTVADSLSEPVAVDGKTAKQFERLKKLEDESTCLDPGFKLKDGELHFFKSMKNKINTMLEQPKSQRRCSLMKYCISLVSAGGDSLDPAIQLEDLSDSCWSKVFAADPPEVLELSKTGISFATIHDLLRHLASFLCERGGNNIKDQSLKWLFTILLVLDELHAMIESISYELQRIKRALSRRLQATKESLSNYQTRMQESEVTTEQQRHIANLTLNICIIRQHFNQR